MRVGVVGRRGWQERGLITYMRTHTVVRVRVEVWNVVLNLLYPASSTQRIPDSRKVAED